MIHKHKKFTFAYFVFFSNLCLSVLINFASMFSSHLSDVTLSLFLSSSVLFILKYYLILFQTFLFVCSYPDFLKDAGLLKAAYMQL